MSDEKEKVRLDRWLWAARFYKTRSTATRAVAGGKVQVNGRRAKPSSTVRPGDEVRVRKKRLEWHLIVRGIADRRGSASEAAKLFEETAESRRTREARARQQRAMPDFDFRDGRPTKKERRALDRLRGFRKK